jgi:hypothetical protein
VTSPRFPTASEMRSLVDASLRSCEPELASKIRARLIEPQRKILKWEYGSNEEHPARIFANLGERNVYAAYCLGGFGALGTPWGLVFGDNEHFGQDAGWYPSMRELFVEWSIPSDA